MGGEIYQAQVIRNFFDCITGTDRNLTRIYMCVMSLAKLRMEPPEKMTSLVDQLRKSKIQKELSVDILDYMCDAANQWNSVRSRPRSVSRTSGKWPRTLPASAWTASKLAILNHSFFHHCENFQKVQHELGTG